MPEIIAIEPFSIADKLGLNKGDKIISINGQPIRDYIDFQYKTADPFFVLEIRKDNGEYWKIDIEREVGEKVGIILDKIIYDDLKLCTNNCIFCFVNQQPKGMRSSLLIKDDDFRFSFLQGSFITLTNLKEKDFSRIIDLKLTPLNISVHTTNSKLRQLLMKNPQAGKILTQLNQLAEKGISFNTQIVLCPGINDKKELDRTLRDLINLYPNTLSIGIVPVGLTKYRENLYNLQKYNKEMARMLVQQVRRWQNKLKKFLGKNFIYLSDEFYLLADEDIPAYDEYNGFPQLENGIGLTCMLRQEFIKLKENLPNKTKKQFIAIVTGKLGQKVLQSIIEELNLLEGLNIKLISISNHYFGQTITVTGLLTGEDIITGLKRAEMLPDKIIIPGVALNDKGYFLDDLRLEDIKNYFPKKKFYICKNMADILEVVIDGKINRSNCWQT